MFSSSYQQKQILKNMIIFKKDKYARMREVFKGHSNDERGREHTRLVCDARLKLSPQKQNKHRAKTFVHCLMSFRGQHSERMPVKIR